MVELLQSCDRKGISRVSIYDASAFLYVLALFVFENETYSYVFSIIQLAFIGVSVICTIKRGYIRKSVAYPWAFFMVALAFTLSAVYSTPEVWGTFQIIVRNMVKVLLFTLYLNNTASLKKLICYIAVSGVVCGLFLVGEFFSSGMVYTDLRYATNSRVGASIAGGNVNVVSMYMCFAFAACLFMSDNSRTRSEKLLYLIFAIFIVATSLLTGSRKILYFYVVVYALYNLSKGPKFLVSFVLVLGVSYFALMNIEPLYFLVGHKIDVFGGSSAYLMYGESDQERMNAAIGGLRTFLAFPLGIGFGNSYNYIGIYAHNNFVEVLMDGGLVGFLAYYWVYARGILIGFRNKENCPISKFIFVTTIGLLLLEIQQVTYLYSIPIVYLSILLNSDLFDKKIKGEAGSGRPSSVAIDGRTNAASSSAMNIE